MKLYYGVSSINPEEVYTTTEVQVLLKISSSTIKRLMKKGLLRANKIGGQYRIMGKEILRIVSPVIERKTVNMYQKIKKTIKKKTRNW